MFSIEGQRFNFTVEWGQKTFSRAFPEGDWMFFSPCLSKQNQVFFPRPQDIKKVLVLTETGSYFKPKRCFSNSNRAFFVHKPNTLWQAKNSTFFLKVDFCQISTYHGPPAPCWEMVHRDRCERCRLMGSGPNHSEAYGRVGVGLGLGNQSLWNKKHIAVFSLHIIVYFQFLCLYHPVHLSYALSLYTDV